MLMTCKGAPWLGVSGGTPYLFPARQAQGPLRAHSFGGGHFCIIFRYDILHCFCIYFDMDSDLHFGSMLASFSIVVALPFRASILHEFVIDFATICVWNMFVDFHCLTSNWRNPQNHLYLLHFCMVYPFADTCFFYNVRDMFRCSLLHRFDHILHQCWHHFGSTTLSNKTGKELNIYTRNQSEHNRVLLLLFFTKPHKSEAPVFFK